MKSTKKTRTHTNTREWKTNYALDTQQMETESTITEYTEKAPQSFRRNSKVYFTLCFLYFSCRLLIRSTQHTANDRS